ncbi:MAG: hypothetical protein K0U29_07780 [Gammaproteobacteria bacterium]|nr:hypothetical protein [Gammaproteobacteria bacterium]MCH9744811.1 hypothetical protein [Gammaproteobacteria bacterium]
MLSEKGELARSNESDQAIIGPSLSSKMIEKAGEEVAGGVFYLMGSVAGSAHPALNVIGSVPTVAFCLKNNIAEQNSFGVTLRSMGTEVLLDGLALPLQFGLKTCEFAHWVSQELHLDENYQKDMHTLGLEMQALVDRDASKNELRQAMEDFFHNHPTSDPRKMYGAKVLAKIGEGIETVKNEIKYNPLLFIPGVRPVRPSSTVDETVAIDAKSPEEELHERATEDSPAFVPEHPIAQPQWRFTTIIDEQEAKRVAEQRVREIKNPTKGGVGIAGIKSKYFHVTRPKCSINWSDSFTVGLSMPFGMPITLNPSVAIGIFAFKKIITKTSWGKKAIMFLSGEGARQKCLERALKNIDEKYTDADRAVNSTFYHGGASKDKFLVSIVNFVKNLSDDQSFETSKQGFLTGLRKINRLLDVAQGEHAKFLCGEKRFPEGREFLKDEVYKKNEAINDRIKVWIQTVEGFSLHQVFEVFRPGNKINAANQEIYLAVLDALPSVERDGLKQAMLGFEKLANFSIEQKHQPETLLPVIASEVSKIDVVQLNDASVPLRSKLFFSIVQEEINGEQLDDARRLIREACANVGNDELSSGTVSLLMRYAVALLRSDIPLSEKIPVLKCCYDCSDDVASSKYWLSKLYEAYMAVDQSPKAELLLIKWVDSHAEDVDVDHVRMLLGQVQCFNGNINAAEKTFLQIKDPILREKAFCSSIYLELQEEAKDKVSQDELIKDVDSQLDEMHIDPAGEGKEIVESAPSFFNRHKYTIFSGLFASVLMPAVAYVSSIMMAPPPEEPSFLDQYGNTLFAATAGLGVVILAGMLMAPAAPVVAVPSVLAEMQAIMAAHAGRRAVLGAFLAATRPVIQATVEEPVAQEAAQGLLRFMHG